LLIIQLYELKMLAMLIALWLLSLFISAKLPGKTYWSASFVCI